jgi:hypothetical protein
MTGRALVKRALVALLDELADEHPAGHQPGYAARYVLTTDDGTQLEIMIEKGERSPPNVWMLRKAGAGLQRSGISAKTSPKSKLGTKIASNGKPAYGRHTGLRPMDQLAGEDLVYFVPENLTQVGSIIDHLLRVEAADLA